MGGRNREKLFLLEFLIDKVNLKECDVKRHKSNINNSLLVTVKIEDFLFLEINQDALKKEETHFGVTWHLCCGKSCIFPMEPRQLLHLLKKHPCYFFVGMLNRKCMTTDIIGGCQTNICLSLSDAILKAELTSDKYPKISAIHQDIYNLRCPLGEDVGFISILVRLTCFGQAVFTCFNSMNGDNRIFLYENVEPEAEKYSDNEETEEESLNSAISEDEIHIIDETDTYNYTCQFDSVRQKESHVCVHEKQITVAQIRSEHRERTSPKESIPCPPTPLETPAPCLQSQDSSYPITISCPAKANISLPVATPKATIICTNIEELLPDSPFARRFADDLVPVMPQLSNNEDENIELSDEEIKYSSKREMQLSELCKTMFLFDRSVPQLCEDKKELATLQATSPSGVYHPSNPPVRYDTTSALSVAYGGRRPVPPNTVVEVEDEKKHLPNPPVRYDTTGVLSPAHKGDSVQPATFQATSPSGVYHPSNPPVRYDTTSALSAAYGGHRPVPPNTVVELEDEKKHLPNPPVRYDTTGILSSAHKDDIVQPATFQATSPSGVYHPSNPPVRYDTTSALSAAYGGHRPIPPNTVVEVENEKKHLPNPPVRYDTTGALSPAYKGGIVQSKMIKSDHKKQQKLVSGWDGDFVIPIPSVAFPKILTLAWKKSWRYRYRFGDQHPGVKIGHTVCVPEFVQVPGQIGWLWKLYAEPGWKPGAVRKVVKNIFKELLQAAGKDDDSARGKEQTDSKKKGSKGKSKASTKHVSAVKSKKEKVQENVEQFTKTSGEKRETDKDQEKIKDKKKGTSQVPAKEKNVELPPTLHIHEQDGNYYISLQPINVYPENVNIPLQFRIPVPKSKRKSSKISELKVDYQAPGVYWPAKAKTHTLETQYDTSDFYSPPPVEFLMEPKQDNCKR